MALVSASWLRSRIKPSFTVVIIVIVLFAIVSSGVIGVASRFYNPDEVYGFERIYYYATALRLFVTHPLLGVGAGNYQFFDRSYEGEAAGGIAHNQFLTLAAETGLVGILFFLWLLLALLRIRKQLRSPGMALGDSYNWVRVAGSAFLLVWIAECFFQEGFFATAAAGGGMHVMTVIVFPWIFIGVLLAMRNSEQPPITDTV
jgi:O-antigen ligase